MNAYLNISDFSNALNICKAYKRGKYGYDFQDYVLARQYASEFMKEIWSIVKKCQVSLKEAFSLIRWNTASITTKTLETLKSWLKPIKSLSPKAISQVLRAERQQARQNEASDLTMRIRVTNKWLIFVSSNNNLKNNKMRDLTTKEGRIAEIEKLENSFLKTLKGNGFDVAPDAVCRITKSSIELGIADTCAYMDKGFKMAFASDISLYAAEPDNIFGRKENEINFGSSGCFTPDVKESYWRTVHAASLLKNWAIASDIVNTHCKMYADLEKECFEQKVSS